MKNLRRVTLFIAMSLDGYISDINGGVDWLGGQNSAASSEDDMVSYNEFIKGIDTVIMGYKTYRQIAVELFAEEWPYGEQQSFVVTHRDLPESASENIVFTDEEPGSLVRSLKQREGAGIWICGGASIANQLLEQDLIDRFHISIIPTILGGGIRLFETFNSEKKLQLIETKSYNGIVDLIYERR